MNQTNTQYEIGYQNGYDDGYCRGFSAGYRKGADKEEEISRQKFQDYDRRYEYPRWRG